MNGGTRALSLARLADAETSADWRAHGACTDADPDLFFPDGETKVFHPQIAEARAYCGRCPVTAACLDYALATNQTDGIWGDTLPSERLRHARRQTRDTGPSMPDRVLAMLNQGTATSAEIADTLNVDRGYVYKVLGQLITAGRVEIEPDRYPHRYRLPRAAEQEVNA